MNRQKVAQLVDALDHPDAVHQRDVMDQLVAEGPDIIDPLVANLSVAEPRARKCIVRVLAELDTTEALLPLMRFVFDTRESIVDGDARGLAMQAISGLATDSHASKVFQFLLDIYQDDDPFVRGYAIEAMGKFGDRRALPLVQEALADDQEFVQEKARDAVAALETKISEAHDEDVDDEELLQAIRGKQGGEREYYLNQLRTRDNAFELAERLVTEGGRGVIAGLEYMLESNDPRARSAARRHALSNDSPSELAICLRILSDHIRGDATEDELAVIRGALYNTDSFVQLAALEAAGVSGDDTLIERAVDATRNSDMDRRYAAAAGLSVGLRPEHRKFLPDLIEAVGLANARRLAVVSDDTVRIEAYLIRAIHRVVSEGGFGTSQAQEVALTSLEGALDMRPLVVTALELLDDTTPEEGYDEDRRWPTDATRRLADLLAHPDDAIRDRTLNLLLRGAPSGLNAIIPSLERIIYDRGADIAGKVIPLLERVGTDDAIRLLGDLTEEKDDEVRVSAEAALKRLRNAEPYIDAEFEETDGDV
jgi:HEAT repeat protein